MFEKTHRKWLASFSLDELEDYPNFFKAVCGRIEYERAVRRKEDEAES